MDPDTYSQTGLQSTQIVIYYLYLQLFHQRGGQAQDSDFILSYPYIYFYFVVAV